MFSLLFLSVFFPQDRYLTFFTHPHAFIDIRACCSRSTNGNNLQNSGISIRNPRSGSVFGDFFRGSGREQGHNASAHQFRVHIPEHHFFIAPLFLSVHLSLLAFTVAPNIDGLTGQESNRLNASDMSSPLVNVFINSDHGHSFQAIRELDSTGTSLGLPP